MSESFTPAQVAAAIDHTLLKPEATAEQIRTLCVEAHQFNFASVCVNSVYVPLAAECLRDSRVAVCTVVGFPLGASLSVVKAYEASQAIAHGAREIDMVLAVGALKGGDTAQVQRDIETVVAACRAAQTEIVVKVILETCLLTEAEKVTACEIAQASGANFVKTSTGFSSGGATISDVQLMRQTVGAALGVKASGGIRTWDDAVAMLAAGANRLGASAGVKIVQHQRGEGAY